MKTIQHKKSKALLVLFLGLGIISVLPNFSIEITSYELVNSKIPESFNGFKILQISDLHNESFGDKQVNLIKKIKSQAPNLIVITGDLIDRSHPNLQIAMDLIDGIKDVAPLLFVSGNHESWLDDPTRNKLWSLLRSAGVTVLENETTTYQNDAHESIEILGLSEDASPLSTLTSMTSSLNPLDFKILLAHHPERLEAYALAKIDLVFSGHAHGGQMRLPFIGGLVAPDQGFFPKYSQGLTKLNETTMVISRGLGNSIVPVRFFNGPELVVLTLHKS